jgi:soluble lytic murein transglycosylase
MTMRNSLAKIIPVLWLSLGSVLHAATLAEMVSAYREAPSVPKRAAIEAYAFKHAADSEGALANLALGVIASQQKDYHAAVNALKKVQPRIPQLADYTAFYLAAARVESNVKDAAPQDLLPLRKSEVRSPLAAKSWIVEARILAAAQPAEGLRLLAEHYTELPQPEGDLTIAEIYQSAGDLSGAVRYYQRVYFQYVSGDAVSRAAAALNELQQTMGAAYPNPEPQLLLARADRMADAHEYKRARAEYLSLASKLTGPDRELAYVRVGVMDYLANRTAAARSYLRNLELPAGPADAERLYYLVECARRLKDDDAMMSAVDRLSQYPASPWRLKGLISAANRYLLINRPADYVPLYKAAYENFPADPAAGLYHWKVTFQSYLHNALDSERMLRDHLLQYPQHNTAGAALYFLGRRMEQDGKPGAAAVYYRRIAGTFPNHYYAMLSRERLREPSIAAAAPAPEAVAFAASLKLVEARAVPAEGTRISALRIERSQLLRAAGLADLADAELRFGARTDGPPSVMAMALAESAAAPHQAMRIMKNLSPDYLSLSLDQAPRKYWDLLFPLPFRNDLEQHARTQGIDTFLLAGLIRQESEFNPQAVSRAKAYGLTQIRPGTGRQFARTVGMRSLATRQLFQPETNLKIGTSILRSMLDDNGGALERTLASYNAGPSRSAEWITWNTYREPAEFVESIPFTETRDYVQAVLRNADIYRRLYR